MSEPTCHCGRPSSDAFLCWGCTDDLRKILAEMPAWLDELALTVARLAKTSRPDGGKPTRRAEQPLPYDAAAADLAAAVRNALGTTVRHLCESRGVEVPRLAKAQDMATWLTDKVESIRQDEAAEAILAGMRENRAAIMRRVDNLGRRWAGPCTAIVTERTVALSDATTAPSVNAEPRTGPAGHSDLPGNDNDAQNRSQHVVLAVVIEDGETRECGADLRTRSGERVIRCKACGAEYDPVERARWTLAQSLDHQASATFIAHALTDAGYAVKAGTISKWASRGKLFAWREDGVGRPIYRVGDVLELVEAARRERGEDGRVSA